MRIRNSILCNCDDQDVISSPTECSQYQVLRLYGRASNMKIDLRVGFRVPNMETQVSKLDLL